MVTRNQKPENSVSVWQPLRDLEEIGRRFGNEWPAWREMWRAAPFDEMRWAPAIDVIEKEDKYLVKVELPGVKETDVDVSITGDILTISGEKRTDSESKKDGYYYSESSYGRFSRSVTIPSTVDIDRVNADYDKGVLQILLPKLAEIKPKKVPVAMKQNAGKTAKKPANTRADKK